MSWVCMQVDLSDLLSSAQAALQGAAGAVLTPSLSELASRLEQLPQAASSAAYYDSFVAGRPSSVVLESSAICWALSKQSSHAYPDVLPAECTALSHSLMS